MEGGSVHETLIHSIRTLRHQSRQVLIDVSIYLSGASRHYNKSYEGIYAHR